MPHTMLNTALRATSPAFNVFFRGLIGLLMSLATALAVAAPVATGTWEHAISAFQPPKYPRDYTHFEYANPAAPKGGLLKLSNPDRRSSFDKYNPYTVKGLAPAAMRIFVFETLAHTSMDEPQAAYGLIAEEMMVALDLSAISFRIHPKARFSNGDAVTPADVVHSFKMMSGPQASPEFQTDFSGIAQAVVVDARTVRFELKKPSLDAIFAATKLPVFSTKWTAGRKFNEVVTDLPIATGPYTITKAQMPSRFEMRRNPDYWAQNLPVRKGFYNFDRIVYRMYKAQDVRREAFKAGEFDLYKEYTASQYARNHQGPKWRDGRIVKQTFTVGTGVMMQAFNLNLRRPKFQDARVREALMLAFDFEKYNRFGTFERADSMFNKDELALLEPFRAQLPAKVFGPPYRKPRNDTGPNALRDNLRRAQELLIEAGWKIAPDGLLRNAKGDMLTLDYMDPTRVGRFPEFESNLRKLGVKYSERLVDYALFHRRTETFDFDLVIIVEPKFTLPDAGNIDSLYSSEHARKEGGSNLRGVQSPAVDALIKRIADAATMDELKAASR
ncbi:MAG: ABC transporter substrate-binding protein, partial [Burkholderiales bacterium PBB5]